MTVCLGTLAGCGSQENAYAGKWVAIAVTLGDYTTPQTAADSQYTIDIAKDSSAQINVEGTSGSGKCSVKDNTMTLKVEGETTEGTIDGDKITFDDMFGMGTTIIFAKDGSEAMNPALYISDIEKKTLGSWKAESYKEILDDTPRTSMTGTARHSLARRRGSISGRGTENGRESMSFSSGSPRRRTEKARSRRFLR